jgi:hypothetical protein
VHDEDEDEDDDDVDSARPPFRWSTPGPGGDDTPSARMLPGLTPGMSRTGGLPGELRHPRNLDEVFQVRWHLEFGSGLVVMPAWALPVPVSDGPIRARLSPASAGQGSNSTGENRQHNCFVSALVWAPRPCSPSSASSAPMGLATGTRA